MADMLHWIGVGAGSDRVFDAVTTAAGLRSWWTDDVEAEPAEGSIATFGFGNRSVVFRMRIDRLDRPRLVRWTCLGDFDEWTGTRLSFEFRPTSDGGTGVTFTHSGWESTEGYYRQCNTDWGRLMYFLKDHVETGASNPMMR
jgi:uncharacterized protein YndB with AHSA1/START domain